MYTNNHSKYVKHFLNNFKNNRRHYKLILVYHNFISYFEFLTLNLKLADLSLIMENTTIVLIRGFSTLKEITPLKEINYENTYMCIFIVKNSLIIYTK